MSNPIATVWRKELKDALRDKRSVMAAMSYAFFGPLFMAVAFYFLISQLTDPSDVEIDISGTDHAPALVEHLNQQGIVQRDKPWPAGTTPIELEIPANWGEQIGKGIPVEVIITADFSAQKQTTDLRRLEKAISAYGNQIAFMRLQMRGIDPNVANPITLIKHDTATQGSRAALLMGSVLIFFLMSVFFSGMNVAIDISAGERERNSLELLLAQPLSSHQLVYGKALAASCFAMFGGVLCVLLTPLVFQFLPLHEIGMSVSLSAADLLLIIALLAPLALLATALQLFVSFRAKSFKEAQTYISLLLMVPMIAVFGVEFARLKSPALYYLPVTGQHQALLDLIKGESLQWLPLGLSALATLVVSWILMRLIGKMLASEKVVFGL
ncbi:MULTISPECIES: ABC transporter permease [Idiomarinaceae]|uniref:Sodium transport system permease protein n=2 Tax=Pseudidiomarina TaxID=2800384 RepID=A0A368UL77_9GAMM|nr:MULTISPECIES: ABC transporter permease subunit [Idiomarinaceae]MRJ41920.1 ABC transporter permease subunit [Idiomarina sp. FeN1]NCU57203.1 ABC transporter permease subunit [Idiomarina sp. FenA--70]NCU59912.1 ABC transporter permease subunit [Idiomarina sp. FenBw--71]PWW09711.1 sodium transport system permease protein [Pseudidiomarina maritima]RBP87427.1 sodium transport system permease protein [Pseudidiomarina tainanensis]